MSNFELETRAKWIPILAAMPFGQEFEFEMPDEEAQVVMMMLDERGDTVFTQEFMGSRKSYAAN